MDDTEYRDRKSILLRQNDLEAEVIFLDRNPLSLPLHGDGVVWRWN
jgi:hypothetical protein